MDEKSEAQVVCKIIQAVKWQKQNLNPESMLVFMTLFFFGFYVNLICSFYGRGSWVWRNWVQKYYVACLTSHWFNLLQKTLDRSSYDSQPGEPSGHSEVTVTFLNSACHVSHLLFSKHGAQVVYKLEGC